MSIPQYQHISGEHAQQHKQQQAHSLKKNKIDESLMINYLVKTVKITPISPSFSKFN